MATLQLMIDKIVHTRDILKACKNVGFVNIGRGNVIQEEDIISALDGGMLRAAVLDVFNTEPLPPASPLWSHPRVTGNTVL